MSLPDYLIQPVKPAHSAMTVANNGFFPVVSVAAFEAAYDVDGSVSPQRRLERLTWAVLEVNEELQSRACHWVQQGYDTLAAVPQDTWMDEVGKSELTLLRAYREAVYAKAMQALGGTYRATDTTRYAERRAEAMEGGATIHELHYRRAIQVLMGRGHRAAWVELL